MNIDKGLVELFKEYVATEYGGEWESLPIAHELGRVMLLGGTRCMILREHFPRRNADTVEVFLTDKELLNKIEGSFYCYVSAMDGASK